MAEPPRVRRRRPGRPIDRKCRRVRPECEDRETPMSAAPNSKIANSPSAPPSRRSRSDRQIKIRRFGAGFDDTTPSRPVPPRSAPPAASVGPPKLISRHAATSAIAMVTLSRQNARAMFQTACATTATATNCRPCNKECANAPLQAAVNAAQRYISSADGNVNPTQAASAPIHPARCSPMENPI